MWLTSVGRWSGLVVNSLETEKLTRVEFTLPLVRSITLATVNSERGSCRLRTRNGISVYANVQLKLEDNAQGTAQQNSVQLRDASV